MGEVGRLLKRAGLALAGLLLSAILVVAALLYWPLPSAPGPAASGSLLLNDVNILDVETGAIRQRQAVWIDAGRITRISDALPAGRAPRPGAGCTWNAWPTGA